MILKKNKKHPREAKKSFYKRLEDAFFLEIQFLRLNDKPVSASKKSDNGRGTFFHISSNFDELADDRVYSELRTSLALNTLNIIRNVSKDDNIVEIGYADKSDGSACLRTLLLFNLEENNEYLVCLKEFKDYYLLVTGYALNSKSSRQSQYDNILIKMPIKFYEKYNNVMFSQIEVSKTLIICDPIITSWIKHRFNPNFSYRLLSTAIKSKQDKIVFSTSRFDSNIPAHERQYVQLISLNNRGEIPTKFVKFKKKLKKMLAKIAKINSSFVPNKVKLVKIYDYINFSFYDLIDGSKNGIFTKIYLFFTKRTPLGKRKIVYWINGLAFQYGYALTSQIKFKTIEQFYNVCDEIRHNKVLDPNNPVFNKFHVDIDVENNDITLEVYVKYYIDYFCKVLEQALEELFS